MPGAQYLDDRPARLPNAKPGCTRKSRYICRRATVARIVLTRDPDGSERCVACNLCAVACPVGCISLQKAETVDGRWYPEFFRINFTLHLLWSV